MKSKIYLKAILAIIAVASLAPIFLHILEVWYFSKIHSGMSVGQVEEALGQPQQVVTNDDGSLRLNYKRWWAGGRSIDFDTNGIAYGSWQFY